jgi:hypothetical protein
VGHSTGVVVYSIQSASSFEAAASMLEAIQRLKVPFYLPVLLLANKNDLEHYRQVRTYQADGCDTIYIYLIHTTGSSGRWTSVSCSIKLSFCRNLSCGRCGRRIADLDGTFPRSPDAQGSTNLGPPTQADAVKCY